MSSPVGSSPMRSSWRWSRCSSPDSFAPPRSDMLRSLLKRSRSRSSCSDGGIEDPQEPAEGRAQLGPRDDGIDLAEAEVLLGAAEVVRQLLARQLLHDAGAGERHERAGLGEEDVAQRGEACEDAAGRRMR